MEKNDQKNLELLSPTLLKHKKRKKLNAKKNQLITKHEMGFETSKFCNRVIYYRILTTNPLQDRNLEDCMKYNQELNFI